MSSRPSLWRLKALLALPLSVGFLAIGGAAADLADAAPPPGRAYEIVSPVDDPAGSYAGLSNDRFPLPGIASDDGDVVVFGSPIALGDSWSGANNALNFGRRTANGWVAEAANRSLDYGDTPLEIIRADTYMSRLTPDGQYLLFGSNSLGAYPAPPGQNFAGIFRSPISGEVPDWLSQPASGITPSNSVNPFSFAASPDGKVVAFSSTQPLLPEAPAPGTSGVYAWRDGDLELVSRLPDGSIPTANAVLANESVSGDGGTNPPAVTGRNQVAANGRFIYFRVGGNSFGSIFVRDLEKQVTRQLSGGAPGTAEETMRLGADWGGPGQAITFDQVTVPPPSMVFASRDGSLAYFKPAFGLADDAYLAKADAETGAVSVLTEVKGPPLGLSPDGRRMLFLVPPPPADPDRIHSLRYWDADTPDTSVEVAEIPSPANPPFGIARVYRVSEDGLTWLFSSRGILDPDRENANPETQQLYFGQWAMRTRPASHVNPSMELRVRRA